MKTPDRRITVLAYTMISIWLLIYAYACFTTRTVAVQALDGKFSPAVTRDAPADIPDGNQRVESADGLRIAGLVSRVVNLEKKDAGGVKRFRVSAG